MSTSNGKITDPKVEAAVKQSMPSPQAVLQAMRYDHIRRTGDIMIALFNSMPFMPDPKIDDAFEAMFNVMAGSAVRSKIPYAYLKDRLKVRYEEVERQTRGEKPALSLVGPDGAPVSGTPSTDDEKTDPGTVAGTESPASPAEPAPAAPSPEGSPAPAPETAPASSPTATPGPQPDPPAEAGSTPPAAPEPPPAS
jgi:hypothetical protein